MQPHIQLNLTQRRKIPLTFARQSPQRGGTPARRWLASAPLREIIIFTSSPKYTPEHNQAIPEHVAQNLYYS